MVEDCQATQLGSTPKSIPASLWQLASDALSAGAATLSTTAAAAAGQPVGFSSDPAASLQLPYVLVLSGYASLLAGPKISRDMLLLGCMHAGIEALLSRDYHWKLHCDIASAVCLSNVCLEVQGCPTATQHTSAEV